MSTSTTLVLYPVQAELATSLSRWLWLVKWIVAIPHHVVLVFMWLAFAVRAS